MALVGILNPIRVENILGSFAQLGALDGIAPLSRGHREAGPHTVAPSQQVAAPLTLPGQPGDFSLLICLVSLAAARMGVWLALTAAAPGKPRIGTCHVSHLHRVG